MLKVGIGKIGRVVVMKMEVVLCSVSRCNSEGKKEWERERKEINARACLLLTRRSEGQVGQKPGSFDRAWLT